MKNKKIILRAISIILIVFVSVLFSMSSTVSAFSVSNYKNMFNFSFIKSYNTSSLLKDLENLKKKNNLGEEDLEYIVSLVNKLPEGEDKEMLNYMMKIYSTDKESTLDISSLINTLISFLKGLFTNTSLPTPTSIYMDANTSVQFAGSDYAAKLHANVYKHVNDEGQEDSEKWVLLIHPYQTKGTEIAKAIGYMYYEKGYNILAPDSRGFGESEGSCATGFLESLDAYDWLNVLNNNYDVSKIMIHGISLGGATTNFLSGIDQFIANGPTNTITDELHSLRELKVVGLTEDCGYTNMTEFASKSILLTLGTGLNEDNFDYYSDATNSLKYCDLPMQIIHGTFDFIVNVSNAETVENTVKGYTQKWLVDNAPHAFIIVGMNSSDYSTHVQEYIDYIEALEENDTTDSQEEVENINEKSDSLLELDIENITPIINLKDKLDSPIISNIFKNIF